MIFQTFQPKHFAILAAERHDYEGFYQGELAERQGEAAGAAEAYRRAIQAR